MDASAHHAAGPRTAGRTHPRKQERRRAQRPAVTPRREPLTSARNVPRNPLLPRLKTRSAKQGTQTSHSHLESGTKTGSKEKAPQSCSPARPARGGRSHARREGRVLVISPQRDQRSQQKTDGPRGRSSEGHRPASGAADLQPPAEHSAPPGLRATGGHQGGRGLAPASRSSTFV